ncbi:MAG: xanthine dehydrogenase family protein subunit M [SAR324 cluster bacterium]|nr:xanthine dehydrogenase family protein subunit M [SAR324 cluster bacterium]MBL7034545.1 xanthine dehydrogenase family protein subunit M [SAR324 cluster bacterium]
MIPESFDYQRASSVSDAISLLHQHGEGAKILAGGHSLVPTMKLRLSTPATLIDIGDLTELKYISDKGDYLAIGAGATHWMLESSDLIQQKAPALSQSAGQVGDVQVRNRGTIGGVLAHSDPQADYPGVILALNATIVVQGSGGERTIAAADYFTGLWETALEETEILTEVRIPTDNANANSCYLKFPQPASRYPYVGCAVAMSTAGGSCAEIRVGFSGVGETAFRDSGVENALQGQALSESSIAAASAKAAEGRSVLSDVFVSEEYRRAMAQVYAKRALSQLS